MADRIDVEQQTGEDRKSQAVQPRARPRRRRRAMWLLVAALPIIGIAAYEIWSYYSIRESTDDAQIDGHITPISARVSGTVLAVNVDDNQYVEAGAVLVRIDPRDYEAALDRAAADVAAANATAQSVRTGVPITSTTTSSKLSTAEAAVQAAEAAQGAAEREVDSARARLDAARAELREAEAKHTKNARDLERMKQLVDKEEISRQQYDAAVAAEAESRASVESADARVTQAEKAIPVAESHVIQARAALAQALAAVRSAQTAPEEVAASRAQVGTATARIQQAAAAAEQSRLNLEYTTVKAPVSGIVSNKTVQVGQFTQPGQPLLAIVPLEDIWVKANFKETQLNQMRPGQQATISVDAYGGSKYRGHVDSIAAATGEKFSLLPPENATGNYVKVVQRIPVKLVFEKGQDPRHLLRPGMSVVVTVITK